MTAQHLGAGGATTHAERAVAAAVDAIANPTPRGRPGAEQALRGAVQREAEMVKAIRCSNRRAATVSGDSEPPARFNGCGYSTMLMPISTVTLPPANDPLENTLSRALAMLERAAGKSGMSAAETWCDACRSLRDPSCQYHRCPFKAGSVV